MFSVKTLGQDLTGFFDSGSQISAIHASFRKFVPIHSLKNCHIKLRSAQGSFFCTQKAILNITIGPISGHHEFWLIKTLPKEMLLGMDFMTKFGISLHPSEGAWSCPEGKFNFLEETSPSTDPTALCFEAVEFIKFNNFIEFPEATESFNNLLNDFEDIFSFKTGIAKCEPIRINTGSAQPIMQPQRCMSSKKAQLVESAIQEMLEMDWIEPSESPWRSNFVCVPKPDGSARCCGDFRPLNMVTVNDAYPAPDVQTILDNIGQAHVFSTFDLTKGFYQIPVAKDDQEKLAVWAPSGLYTFKVMPFGIRNAPKVFQRLMNEVLKDYLNKFAMVYIDDVVIYSKNVDDHINHLKLFFKSIREIGLTLNPKKMQPLRASIIILGHIVSRGSIKPNSANVDSIENLPAPKNTKEVRRVLGMVGYFRSFIPKFALIARPLYKLLKKDVKFIWDDKCQESFEKLKRSVLDVTLALPDLNGTFLVQTDASGLGLGAVLLTKTVNNKWKPVAFISRTLQGGEPNYTTTELECLAVVWALEKFKPYLEHTTFSVETDHMAIKWLMTIDRPKGRLARWILHLQTFEFEILYRPGKINWVADILSRHPNKNNPDNSELFINAIGEDVSTSELLAEELINLQLNRKEIQSAQLDDPLLKHVCDYLKTGKLPEKGKANLISKIKTIAHQSFIDSDGLLIKWKPADEWDELQPCVDERIILPDSLLDKVIHHYHSSPLGGHVGHDRVTHRIASKFYCLGLHGKVRKFIAGCVSCQKYNYDNQKPRGLMKGHDYLGPWEEVSVDLMGPYPLTKNRHAYLLVVIDIFSNWVEIFPLRKPQADSKNIIDKMMSVFCRWGFPRKIISDNGPQFTSKLWMGCMKTLDISVKHTSPYHPQANPVERKNRDIKLYLGKFSEHKHADWDQYINEMCFSLRTSVVRSTGFTPAMLLLGKELSAPLDIVLNRKSEKALSLDYSKVAERNALKLKNIVDYCSENRMIASEEQKFHYDKNRKDVEFHVGDLVWLKTHHLSSAAAKFTAGFAPKRDGPFRIMEKYSKNTYLLGDKDSGAAETYASVDKLTKFVPPADLGKISDETDIEKSGETDSEKSEKSDKNHTSPKVDKTPILEKVIKKPPVRRRKQAKQIAPPSPNKDDQDEDDATRPQRAAKLKAVAKIAAARLQRGHAAAKALARAGALKSTLPVAEVEKKFLEKYDKLYSS